MKRLLSLFVLVSVLLASVPAFAVMREFDFLIIDVPEGWTAEQHEETLALAKKDNSAAMTLSGGATGGKSTKEIAEIFAKEFNATTPEPDGEGDYTFSFTNKKGIESNCLVYGTDDVYILLVMTGDDAAQDEMEAIISTIKPK